KAIDPDVRISGNWDSLEVITGDDPALQTALLARLRNTPGINHIHEVREYPLGTLDELAELCVERFADQLAGKTFAVRCKRVEIGRASCRERGTIWVGGVSVAGDSS